MFGKLEPMEVAIVVFLSEILDILTRMNATIQTKLTDFSKLPVLVKVTIEHLKQEESILLYYPLRIPFHPTAMSKSRYLMSSTERYIC